MYGIVCSRCSNNLQIVGEHVSLVRMVVYGGVVCTKCEKVECDVCKGTTECNPCSWCGANVNRVNDYGIGPNVPLSAMR
jgi:hypothetical protein